MATKRTSCGCRGPGCAVLAAVLVNRLPPMMMVMMMMMPPYSGALSVDHYAKICPNLESLVRGAVAGAVARSPIAAAATLRLYFHDCFVRGCDASVMIVASGDEWSHPDDLSLKPEGFNTVVRAKAAVDGDPQCTNKVSCADILALAAREAVYQSGGPMYPVELGRYDGKVSTASSVVLPHPDFNLDQLIAIFGRFNFALTDIIALAGAHTMGAASCSFFSGRLYPGDPTMNPAFAAKLRKQCPRAAPASAFAFLDNTTPMRFDNAYFYNLQRQMGLLGSDQVLFDDSRSAGTVNLFAGNESAFFDAFVAAMTKLGRLQVKTAADGEIRVDCRYSN